MIPITADTALSVISNGQHSRLTAAWYLPFVKDHITDYYSGERLQIIEDGVLDFIEIQTNYAPRVGDHLIFCVHPDIRVRLYDGTQILGQELATLCKKGAVKILGEAGMYEARNAKTVKKRALMCNTTTLSSVFIKHQATNGLCGGNVRYLWTSEIKQRIIHREATVCEMIPTWPVVHMETNPAQIKRFMPLRTKDLVDESGE